MFKVKGNNVYRARLVALGYSQISGLDHGDNFSPVVTKVTFRVALVMMLMNDWSSEIVDVETAFLYGDLDEEIFMKIPEGMKEFFEEKSDQNTLSYDENDCLVLKKSIYGLVQAARQFFKKVSRILSEELGFKTCLADQCLLIRTNNSGTVILCLYIDDICCIGNQEAINDFKRELKKSFNTKEEGNMTEYVGCKLNRVEKRLLVMHQSDLIKKLIKNFGEEITTMRKYVTPSTTRYYVTRPSKQEEVLNEKRQTKYRSGIGILMFLIKFSRPDIANAVRELSKVNSGAFESHYKVLLRVIKYVINTKYYC